MNILSINFGHDSSVCMLTNGCINQYYLSERLTRVKHEKNIDNNLIKSILCHNNIDAVVVSSTHNFNIASEVSYILGTCGNHNLPIIYDYSGLHHLSHAALSYFNSGFNKSLVIVIDQFGSVLNPNVTLEERRQEVESVYYFTKNTHTCLYHNSAKTTEYPIYINDISKITQGEDKKIGIGLLYSMAASLISNSSLECGKPMGLSSYGSKTNRFNNIYNDFANIVDKNKVFLLNPTDITEENYKEYADLCYSIQKSTQEEVGNIIEKHINSAETNNVCLSGGYAMNVVTNHYLLKRFPNLNFYFEPICNDSGISIGAAMHLYSKLKKWYQPRVRPNTTTSFHGYEYSYSEFSQYGVNGSIARIANKLKNNKSVAVYYGRAEAGQRALGNRSILFNALNPNAKEIINKIKNREWYRPFAAAVLQEDAGYYFDMSLMPSSPYMTVAFPTKTDLVPGVTHVDGTCRVQTVTKADGYLYDLLVEFKRITGHGILLNTSLNLAGDPLVETPQEAFDVLMSSNLDYLWFPEIDRVYDHLPIYNNRSL